MVKSRLSKGGKYQTEWTQGALGPLVHSILLSGFNIHTVLICISFDECSFHMFIIPFLFLLLKCLSMHLSIFITRVCLFIYSEKIIIITININPLSGYLRILNLPISILLLLFFTTINSVVFLVFLLFTIFFYILFVKSFYILNILF